MNATFRVLSLAAIVSLAPCAHAASPAKAAGATPAADAAPAAAPAGTPTDVGVFARYAGTWKVELTHVQTPYSKPSSESMTVKNDCWRSEIFYVCDQIIDGAPKALIVFFYNSEEKRFGSFPITARSDTVHPGDVQADGNTIIFPWAINDNGKTIYMRIVNVFKSADTMDFRQEYSEDNTKWVAMATGVEHKIGGKGPAAKSK